MEKNTHYIRLALAFVLLLCAGTASAATYSGGLGTINEPYQLSSESDIVNLSLDPGDWDMNFILTDDITLVGNHTPIGNGTIQFTGEFNGSGHTISNLTVYINAGSTTASSNVGFFGCTGASANIHDLGIETSSDGVYSIGNNVGGLVGWNRDATVSNSHVTGNVSGSNSVGGLVGNNNGGTINNSHATGNVFGSRTVGGLVGQNYAGVVNYSIVSNSYATGNVSGSSSSSTVGGLIGKNDGTVSYASVNNSFATGNVVTSNGVNGGLVGANNGDVRNCYATGNVSGSTVGGLAGVNNGPMRNCFATGTVSGFSVGGLVGQNNNVIEYCYYSSTGSYTNANGSYTSYVNFTNFSFISGASGLNWNENITKADDSSYIWKIIDGYTLPYFQWQDTPDPVPYVETMSQSSAINNTEDSASFWINVTGCSFYNVTESVFVNLTMDGQTPISGEIDENSLTYNTINAKFDLTKAIVGDWLLYVINPDGQTSTAKSFKVETLPAPKDLTNSTGNFWVNWTWASVENADSYNVSYNDTYWDNSTRNYFNHTDLSAHGWSNVTVYSYNATYSVLSPGVSDKVQIPNNDIGILNVTNITTSEGKSISFNINYTDADNDTAIFGCNQSSLFDSFNTSTGEGSWNVGFSDSGTHYIEFNVSDKYGSVNSQVMKITVANTPTIHVGNGSSYDFSSIQDAVNDASENTTIMVADGTYKENIDVYTSVIIRSENGADYTNVIANDSSYYVFNIIADNVTIDGFNISGATDIIIRYSNDNDEYASGIHLSDISNCTVSNNTLIGNSAGIVLTHSNNNTLRNNIANDNDQVGIALAGTTNNILTNNVAMNNTMYDIVASGNDDEINDLKITENNAKISFLSDKAPTSIKGNATNSTTLSGKVNVNGYFTIDRSGLVEDSIETIGIRPELPVTIKPINITVSYDDVGMSSSGENSINLYKYNETVNGSTWIVVNGTSLNASSNQVNASLSDGTFALFKDPEPRSSGGDSIGVIGVKSSSSETTTPTTTSTTLSVDANGAVTADTSLRSSDNAARVTVEEGTIGTDTNNNPVTKITISKPESIPEGSPANGLYYDFGPSGTTFSKPVLISIEFDPDDYDESNPPVIYTYDEEADEWVALETSIDWDAGTATAKTTHFSLYALFAEDEEDTEDVQASADSSYTDEEEVPVEQTASTGYPNAIFGVCIILGLAVVAINKRK